MSGGQDKIAKSARADFIAGNFKACIEKLQKLEQSNPLDAKVKHNLTLTNYCAFGAGENGLRQTMDKPLALFTDVLNCFATPGSPSGNGKDCFGESKKLSKECVVAAFNRSLMLYSARQYHAAASQLDMLFRFIDSADDRLAQNVCFLLLDVCLLIGDPERASRAFGFLDKATASSSEKDATDEDSIQFRFLLHLYKAKLHIMTKSFKLCKREMKSCLNANNQEPAGLFLKGNFEYLRKNHRKAIKLLNGCPNLPSSIVLPVLYYNNLAIVHFQLNKPNMAAYYFAKAWKANEKLAQAQGEKTGAIILEADKRYELAYNHGVQLLYSGQPKAAFSSFLRSTPAFRNESILWLRLAECCVGVHATSRNGRGVRGGGVGNVSIVNKVVGVRPFKTIVLSASAPDSLGVNEIHSVSLDPEGVAIGNASDFPVAPSKNDSASTSTSTPMPTYTKPTPTPTLQFGLWCARNAMTLARNSSTLNVSTGSNGSKADEDGGGSGMGVTVSVGDGETEGTSDPDMETIEATIKLNVIYLSLHLCDPTSALIMCKSILGESEGEGESKSKPVSKDEEPTRIKKSISPTLKCLAKLYAGEALMRLGRIPEAEAILLPTNENFENAFADVWTGSNKPSADSTGPSPSPVLANSAPGSLNHSLKGTSMIYTSSGMRFMLQSPQTAFKATLLLNLAAGFCRRGDLERAENAMVSLMPLLPQAGPFPPQVVLIAVYMETARGNSQTALRMVKQHSLPLTWLTAGQKSSRQP
eukprot:CFRG7492T1